MIALEEARSILLAGVGPLGEELVALDCLASRVLSRDLVAMHNQPSEPRSKMDGIAIGSWSAREGQSFNLVGSAAAGAPHAGVIAADEAVRVATGAVIPFGAQRVIPKEIVTIDHERASLSKAPSAESFIRVTGADFHKGDVLLPAGTRLHPGALGVVAAANWASAFVFSRPSVAILASGDELVPPGSPLKPGAAIDSASYVIAALVEEWGGIAHRLKTLDDQRDATKAALASAIEKFDLTVTIGGASVGEHDHLRPAAQDLGLEMRFERIAIQPGKPCWNARKARRMCLGLPGNPNSAFVCAHLLLKPLLLALGGERGEFPPSRARLTGPPLSNGERRQFQRGWVFEDGVSLLVRTIEDQDSGLQTALAHANCLVDLPANARFEPGDELEIIPLDRSAAVPLPHRADESIEVVGAL